MAPVVALAAGASGTRERSAVGSCGPPMMIRRMCVGGWLGNMRLSVASSSCSASRRRTCSRAGISFVNSSFLGFLVIEDALAGRAEVELVGPAHLVDLLRRQGHVASLA